jgi:hypothetical protein
MLKALRYLIKTAEDRYNCTGYNKLALLNHCFIINICNRAVRHIEEGMLNQHILSYEWSRIDFWSRC